jgi:predicted nucleotidyltransferase
MPIYKTSFEKIRQDAGMDETLSALERGFQKYNIDFYLVGAVSRDVWLSGLNGITPRRTTADVDFAVFINGKGIYEQLREYLITQEGFNPYAQNAFVLIHENGTEVDLLPFGAVEDDDRKVTVAGTGFTSIQVDGFKEVYEQQLTEVDLEGHAFKICSLPGFVLLKLISWDDRPETRPDDITDISDILRHFFDIYKETIWTDHSDLFADETAELETIATRVLGREIGKIISNSEHLRKRVLTILDNNTADPETSPAALIMQRYFENTLEQSVQLLTEIKKGILENNQNVMNKNNW